MHRHIKIVKRKLLRIF